MHTKLYKALFITIAAIGLLGILTIVLGLIIQDSSWQQYDNRMNHFLQGFYSIRSSFAAFGSSIETNDTIKDFLDNIPNSTSTKNNIVIVDENGLISIKANDNYIQPASNTVKMASNWDMAFVIDQTSGQKHWYSIQGLDTMQFNGNAIDENAPTLIGEIAEPPQSVTAMLESFNYNKTEAFLVIDKIERSGKQYYLLWFRDKGIDDAIYKAANRDNLQLFQYSVPIGLLLLLLYWILAPVWVFLDARRRQIQPLPWALLVLLTNVVGLVVYWIVNAQNKPAFGLTCPACGKAVSKSHLYCPWCTSPLVKSCKGCAKALENEWVACPWCGKGVE